MVIPKEPIVTYFSGSDRRRAWTKGGVIERGAGAVVWLLREPECVAKDRCSMGRRFYFSIECIQGLLGLRGEKRPRQGCSPVFLVLAADKGGYCWQNWTKSTMEGKQGVAERGKEGGREKGREAEAGD